MKNIKLINYLVEHDVVITNRSFPREKVYTNENVINQIKLIDGIHRILMKYYGDGISGINGSIGKTIEDIKVDVKRGKEHIDLLQDTTNLDCMEIFLLEHGREILDKCNQVLRLLDKVDYLSLYRRSMKKKEICLGKVDESNLRAVENLEIGSIKGIRYNLVEEDIISYLRIVKRNNKSININNIVEEYVSKAYLNDNSEKYIEALLIYPYETMKYWHKFRKNKKGKSSKEYLDKISDAYMNEIIL